VEAKTDNNIEYYAYSANRPGDRRCGDFKKIHHLPDDGLFIFTCSDGVGAHIGHYDASKTACEAFIEAFTNSNLNMSERIRESVYESHWAVKRESSGATATFLAAVYSIEDNTAHFFSIGDSAIFLISDDSITKKTDDDSFSVPIRFNDKILTSGGVVKTSSLLSKVLGQEGDFDFDVKHVDIRPGDALILATDGVHNNGPLSDTINTVLESSDINKALKVFIDGCSIANNDDATAVVFISTAFDKDFINNYFMDMQKEMHFPIASHSRLSAKIIANKLLDLIVIQTEYQMMTPILEFLSSSRIFLPKSDLLHYLNISIKDIDEKTLQLLKSLIRRA